MAGLSRRFADAGYKLPKYMLNLKGKTLFEHSVSSFEKYFNELAFIFIVRNIMDTVDFVSEKIEQLGIRKAHIVTLQQPTCGQAETVKLGLEKISLGMDTPITIFNIDTFRPNFSFPNNAQITTADGYLEVFRGSGSNWSFAKPESVHSLRVVETAEKKSISNLCSTGCYHFAKAKYFFAAYSDPSNILVKSELYVAPLYNYLIRNNYRICYHLIDREDVVFCGVPSEYQALIDKD